MSEYVTEGFHGRTGLQQPVGTDHTPEEVVRRFFTLPFERQLDLLFALTPEIVSRLPDFDRGGFFGELRRVPVRDAKISVPDTRGEEAVDFDALHADVLSQSIGGQAYILRKIAPRIVGELDGHRRAEVLDRLAGLVVRADSGEVEPPAAH